MSYITCSCKRCTGTTDMNDLKLWTLTQDLMGSNNLAIVFVVSSQGSSPGKMGFKMLVGPQGRIYGTIGGGVMEANIISELVRALQKPDIVTNTVVNQRRRLVHRKDVDHASGLFCSGSQEIVIAYLKSEYREILQEILGSYNHNDTCYLLISRTDFMTSAAKPERIEDLLHVEPIVQPYRAYIFGAGHVGSAIATQLSLLDFTVTLFDHRDDARDFKLDRVFDELKTGDLSNLHAEIIEGQRTFIIITSNSVDADIDALKLCMEKSVRYIGFMGSKTKIRVAKQRLDSDLTNVNAPIGLSIKNETPAEIAVSVAAEIISIKNS